MTQYIDKAALVAEIKGYISNYKEIVAKINRNDSTWVDSVSMIDAKIDVLQHLLSFLNTLEVKEVEEPVSEDLEKAATKYARKQLSNPDYPTYNDEYEMECAFEAGAQWQKEKACEWLKENKDHPLIGCEDPCLSGYLTDGFIEDFKKAMEE